MRAVARRDHNGERGFVPFPPYAFDWREARLVREWLEDFHCELQKLSIEDRRP